MNHRGKSPNIFHRSKQIAAKAEAAIMAKIKFKIRDVFVSIAKYEKVVGRSC